MEYKTFPALGTKVVDEEQGIVEHVITVFGVLDKVNDIAHPGSWTKTIRERGGEWLVLDMHKTDSVMRALGTPLRVWEVARHELPPEVLEEHPEATGGVKAETQFLMETPEGKGAFVRLRDKAISQWSYGYDALDTDFTTVKGEDGADVRARNLRTVKVYEYGPVLWGAVPGTMVTGVKSDGEPEEAKPAPEVTENTIRIRVRDPGDFQEDAFDGDKFRTMNIGDEDNGIQATIGKLKGETSTTIQSYIFQKDKWTVGRARQWVDDHKKSLDKQMTESGGAGALVPVEEEIMTEEIETAAEWTRAYINDLPDSSFLYIAPGGEKDEDGKTVPRNLRYFPYKNADGSNDLPHLRNAIARIPQSNAPGLTSAKKNALQEKARGILEKEQEKAAEGASEEKVGRVLSQRNADRIATAVTTLVDVLENAGIDIPGVGREAPESEEEEPEEAKPKKSKTADVTADETADSDDTTTATPPPEYHTDDAGAAPAEEQAAVDEAGPDDGPPTSEMLEVIQRELIEIGIVEVESGLQGETRTE